MKSHRRVSHHPGRLALAGALLALIPAIALAERPLPELPPKTEFRALRAQADAVPTEPIRVRHQGRVVDARLRVDEFAVEGEESRRRAASASRAGLASAVADAAGRGDQPRPILVIEGREAEVTEWVAYEVVRDIADGMRFGGDFGLVDIEPLPGPTNTFFRGRAPLGGLEALEIAERMARSNRWGLRWAEAQIGLDRETRSLPPNDPRYPDQWHLNNTGQRGRPGLDINVLPVWGDGITGNGVVIGVIDDGLQIAHEDLAGNVRSDLSYNFVTNTMNPTPPSTSLSHGTSVAGLAAAVWNNDRGVVGVAPGAELAGLRLLGGGTPTDSMEAQSFAFRNTNPTPANVIAIKNNSWGPPDTGTRKEGPGPLAAAALGAAVADGRGGLGTIFVWAAGNGFTNGDNTNYDGYANSRYTISVPAVLDNGVFATYSEQCSCHHVTAPGGSSNIVTTRYNTTSPYTTAFGGTSSSAPIVAGVVALMLEANPNLSWRDVQHVLIDSAFRNDPGQSGWARNGSNRWYNHNYGFGMVDAAAAVALAEEWEPVPPEASVSTSTMTVNRAIPDFPAEGISETVTITAPANFVIESVEIDFVAAHTYRGDLILRLESPSGMVSRLSEQHADGNNNWNWTFTSTAHWGESPRGEWTLTVTDGAAVDVGTWNSWGLRFHGYLDEDSPPDLWLLTD